MDSKSLMIGDWTYIPMAKHTARIDSILSKREAHNDACIVVDLCGQGFLAHYTEEDIEPIPLTAEILEKNGWDGMVVYREYGVAEGVFNGNHDCEIGLDREGRCFLTINSWEYSICEIHSVHELQHALRLCGLTELADNFKV